MIDLSLFRDPGCSAAALLSMGLWAFGVFGIYFFTALYLQNVARLLAPEAGVAFVPMALVMAVTADLRSADRRLARNRAGRSRPACC